MLWLVKNYKGYRGGQEKEEEKEEEVIFLQRLLGLHEY